MWDRRARVTSVHDGDSMSVVLDQGFGDTKAIDLRLLGVYAPELRQPGGPETRAFVEQWLDGYDVGSWPVVVVTARKPRADGEQTSLGRWIGTVTSPDGTDSLNLAVIDFVREHGYDGGVGS